MASSAVTGTCRLTRFKYPWGDSIIVVGMFPGEHWRPPGLRLIPSMFFGPGGLPLPGVNTPFPHSAPNAATSPFYKIPCFPCFRIPPGRRVSLIPMRIRALPVSSGPMQSNTFHKPAPIIRAAATTSCYNFAAVTPALPPADRQSFYGSFMRDVCDKYLTVFADFKYVRSFFDASLCSCAVYTRSIRP